MVNDDVTNRLPLMVKVLTIRLEMRGSYSSQLGLRHLWHMIVQVLSC
jgi:hypothetical protein